MKATVAYSGRRICAFLTKTTPISATVEQVQDTFMSIVGRTPQKWSYDQKHGTHHLQFSCERDEKPWEVTRRVRDALQKLGVPTIARTH